MGKSNAPNKANRNSCRLTADHRPYSSMLGVSIGNGCLASISPLGEVKIQGRKFWGRRSAIMPSRVDECRQRATTALCRRRVARPFGSLRASSTLNCIPFKKLQNEANFILM
jgi:hypothetical protein